MMFKWVMVGVCSCIFMGAENAYSASAPSPLEEEAPAARAPLQSPPSSLEALLAQVESYKVSLGIMDADYTTLFRGSVKRQIKKGRLTTPADVQQALLTAEAEYLKKYKKRRAKSTHNAAALWSDSCPLSSRRY